MGDNLPNDAVMLLSVINTWLRDRYDTLEALCEDNDISAEELKSKLYTIGFEYNPTINQFK